jgi:hypothetical protein
MSASDRRPAAAAGRSGGGSSRLVRVWRELPFERRLAAGAALALFLTLFLPWYQETVIAGGVNSLRSISASLTGWAAFSFVEAAVLLVAVSVLALLFIRAEGGAFHVPGGDGGVITAAGLWTCVLIVWRMFDKEGTSGHGQVATTSGIEWGIFIALAVAGLLTYAGTRIRRAHEPEPPLPGDAPRASRRPDMDADDTWTQTTTGAAPPARRQAPTQEAARPATAPATQLPGLDVTARQAGPADGPRRVRPRSVSAGLDEAGSTPPRPADAADEPTLSARAQPQRRPAPVDRHSVEDLDIADPPTSRLSRVEPSTIRLSGSESETERIRRRPEDEE